MPEYLAPGVYIEEIARGPQPIEGVATSTAALLGRTEHGDPNRPRLVTSYADYVRYFGETAPAGFMPVAVRGFFDNGGRRCYIARIVPAASDPAPASAEVGGFTIQAIGPGVSGNRIWVRLGPASTRGFRLQVFYYGANETVPGSIPTEPTGTPPRILDPDPMPDSTPEDFDDLDLDPLSPNYFGKRVNPYPETGSSALVRITAAPDVGTAVDTFQAAQLADGTGDEPTADPPTSADYVGFSVQVNQRTGLSALLLDPYRDVAIVYAPDADADTITEVITHCQLNRFRFAVIDSPRGQANITDLDPRTSNQTQYAAFYYPWIWVSHPRTGARTLVPPGGYVCGIYARSDNTRGVWKAPANEPIADALDLEFDIDQGQQEVLNPRGVNAIRRFPGRGIRVWGARTLSSDPLWKYVSVRRLFIFLEASIYFSTQWVVFEPNDDRLWARVRQTVTLFLRTQWREGALFGAREEEAFSVLVGRETMTEDDILNGRLIIEVGIAPVRPAEFVIFRVYQRTQEART
ncbi:Phage tail protein [uncultured Defluviicoccus sp.]|uniref:Phage tail protein n=1 Tax=metagenome TaxID=256318 RepID=A0A380TBA7_9ZZZZ|nr:Phage tail protein [uncultured Defluviicoccus sp.]